MLASITRASPATPSWCLEIYSFVFRDSAPKAPYQNSLVHRIISKRPTVGFKRVRMRGVSEEHIRVRYVTNEQRSRRTLFKPTHWAVASWLIFRVAHSSRIDLDMLVVRALKISQLTDGGRSPTYDTMHKASKGRFLPVAQP